MGNLQSQVAVAVPVDHNQQWRMALLPGVMGGLVAQAICATQVSFAYHVHTFLALFHYHLTALLMFSYIFQSNLFQHPK